MNNNIKLVKENIEKNAANINWLLCNLLGAIEIAEVAYNQNEHKAFIEALTAITLYKDALKKHENYSRETGVKYA